jgi:4-hydroxy-2-oxoheptanedioate aldolase
MFMKKQNILKQKLSAGETVFGTWSALGSPAVVNCMAQSGLDFVITDMEHGSMSLETVELQLYYAEITDCSLIVRLGEVDELAILHALDLGAKSIMVSHVSNKADALRVVNATRYTPEGTRGLSPFTRNHSYSDDHIREKMAYANTQIFVGILVEGEEGIQNLEEICETPNLDMVYLGIYDISQSVGEPGDVQHPKVKKVLKHCVDIINNKGLVAGSVARNPEYMKLLIDTGFRFVSYRNDTSVLHESFLNAKKMFDQQLSEIK